MFSFFALLGRFCRSSYSVQFFSSSISVFLIHSIAYVICMAHDFKQQHEVPFDSRDERGAVPWPNFHLHKCWSVPMSIEKNCIPVIVVPVIVDRTSLIWSLSKSHLTPIIFCVMVDRTNFISSVLGEILVYCSVSVWP